MKLLGLSKTFGLNMISVGVHLPTSSQDLASKRALDPPKIRLKSLIPG
jgi:hypothetical protein